MAGVFPLGRTEADSLGIIDLIRKGQANSVPNFALVQVVGCLSRAGNNTWTLTKTSEPVVTRDEEPTATTLRTAEAEALGSETFTLVSVTPFKPETHTGQNMEARGLLYRTRRTRGST